MLGTESSRIRASGGSAPAWIASESPVARDYESCGEWLSLAEGAVAASGPLARRARAQASPPLRLQVERPRARRRQHRERPAFEGRDPADPETQRHCHE